MTSAPLRRALYVLAVAVLALPRLALAQDNGGDQPSLIRDAEIEGMIREWVTPIFAAAGLDPTAVHIYLVNDPTINSFVAGGQNVFLNTGLLLRSQTPNQVIGVVAHETGHIAGGHLVRSQQAMRNASIEGIIAMVLGGAAAAIGHGQGMGGGAMGGAMSAGAEVGERSYLQYSVEQEAKADQAALTFLDRTHQSAKGLLQFFRMLEGEEFLTAERQDPWMRDHPLTSERIEVVAEHVATSPWSNVSDKPAFIDEHKRMIAKLLGFLSPGQALARYKASDPSVAARYARAIAYYRQPDLARAVPLIDGLIHEEPRNPWFEELKGQMLFENGKVADAIAPYEQAVRLAPASALLRVECAQVQIESERPALNAAALDNLNRAIIYENEDGMAWHLLAIGYGREGNIGMSALALAEEAILGGDRKMAAQEASRAVQLLKPGTPARLRAEDLQQLARRNDD